MPADIRISLMRDFTITIDGRRVEYPIQRSYRAVLLMFLLILDSGQLVYSSRLAEALWPQDQTANPSGALKTLVSRLRRQLNEVHPDLAACVVTDQGGYMWRTAPNITVDLERVEAILAQIEAITPHEALEKKLFLRLLELYTGDLLPNACTNAVIQARSTRLREEFLTKMQSALDELSKDKRYPRLLEVASMLVVVDPFNEKTHASIMRAMLSLGRVRDAVEHYKQTEAMFYRQLGVRPGEELQAICKQAVSTGRTLHLNLSEIRQELNRDDLSEVQPGAIMCSYAVFHELYRTAKHSGMPGCLAAVAVSRSDGRMLDPDQQELYLDKLLGIMQASMHKSDIVTRFSASIITVILPMTSQQDAVSAMERLKKNFYRRNTNAGILLNYRLQEL